MEKQDKFKFDISLSVLEHLGRHLYRSFATILGEAVSNSWDADANNVWIYIDKQKGTFFIKDDGSGMTSNDFQEKFLKIGYSKRKDGKTSPGGRPYIGRKGIGKLALLSCADKISIISKVEGGQYVGGVIDNSGLDKAILRDLTPDEYTLGDIDFKLFKPYIKGHDKGTIIYFENMKEEIRNSLGYIRKIIALYFRFSLFDKNFNIILNDKKITFDDIKELINNTEFLWNINNLKDPYVNKELRYDKENLNNKTNLIEPEKAITMKGKVKGFIASINHPKNLNITTTGERVGIDLFVNGRLREMDIMKTIPTARVTEDYLYGQIHSEDLDDEEDRFASGREGIVANDPKYKELLDNLKEVIGTILKDWDEWRRKHRSDGDSENTSISKQERKAEELFNVVSDEFEIVEKSVRPETKEKVDRWVEDLGVDATYNFPAYAECFISENLIRRNIEEKKIPLTKEAKKDIADYRNKEVGNKGKGNISIEIRKPPDDLSYLSMDGLANLVDKRDPIQEACLSRDANEYKPIRDALMHTALLTDDAKNKLTTVSKNIKERVKTLLSSP